MSVYGIRIRVRRTRDNAILYDSQIAAADVTEMILDRDGYVGLEAYVIEALYLPGDPTTDVVPPIHCNRQTMVAMGLHK